MIAIFLLRAEIHTRGSWLHGTMVASFMCKLKSCANLHVTGSACLFKYARMMTKSSMGLGAQGRPLLGPVSIGSENVSLGISDIRAFAFLHVCGLIDEV